jgi:antitoxin YefM
MRATSTKELRDNLDAAIDQVNDAHEPLRITREPGKPPAVLMSLEDFASWEETAYLLQSPCNAERLLKALENLEAGGGVERPLVE